MQKLLEVLNDGEGPQVAIANGLPREFMLVVLAASADAWVGAHQPGVEPQRAAAELLEAAARMVREDASVPSIVLPSAAELAALTKKGRRA